MPELPEVETTCRALRPKLQGRIVRAVDAGVPRLRAPIPLKAMRAELIGQRIVGLRRRAKYLVIDFPERRALVVHLGMTGRCRVVKSDEPLEPHDRVWWELSGGVSWRLHDTRRFGLVEFCRLETEGGDPPSLAGLGPEPLEAGLNADYLTEAFSRRKVPVKPLLLAQEVIAGIGNIYASEALFRAQIDPRRPAAALSRPENAALAKHLKQVLKESIAVGGTTINDFYSADGEKGWFVNKLRVYDRTGEACLHRGCSGHIERIVQAGRATFFCPVCQH